MATIEDLEAQLRRIDGRGYPAYKDLKGSYDTEGGTLLIDHVQGDPFAAPSRVRFRVPAARAAFEPALYANRSRQIALRDALARGFCAQAETRSRRSGSGKSGVISMAPPGQEILERSSVVISDAGDVEARFEIGLPARGRRIDGRAAERLIQHVQELARAALCAEALDLTGLTRHVETAEDADALRAILTEKGWVAFVADGAVLPRRSGADDRPLEGERVRPFVSPAEMKVSVDVPHAGTLVGMAIPRGVTLIVGGGYHGKSTLLRALERGVYNHVPGDGREQVVSEPDAVKIRAEDGRSVAGVDLSPFIGDLPGGTDASCFSTSNASGSTSQAANIIEALETGATTLLLDEDTSATNLMIRDARMQALVEQAGEPITPFVDRVRALFEQRGVSSVIVLGGCGDYFDVADTVIRMQDFVAREVTEEARAVAVALPTGRTRSAADWPECAGARYPEAASMNARRGRRERSVKGRGTRAVQYGTDDIELSAVEQVVDPGQVLGVVSVLERLETLFLEGRSLRAAIDAICALLDGRGIDAELTQPDGRRVAFRRHELAAVVNRLRALRVRSCI